MQLCFIYHLYKTENNYSTNPIEIRMGMATWGVIINYKLNNSFCFVKNNSRTNIMKLLQPFPSFFFFSSWDIIASFVKNIPACNKV